MESQFRRYFSSKSLLSPFTSQSTPDSPGSDLHSVPYESTTPAPKSPVFIHRPLRRSMTEQRARAAADGLAIRSLSYESVLAGKPPVVGGRPQKGNGPVKLQTCRRLSSGELLVTTQDHQRTLEDIREGEYIVGGVEKRHSRASQMRSPTSSMIRPTSSKTPRVQYMTSTSSPTRAANVFTPTSGAAAGAGHLSTASAPDLASRAWSSSSHPNLASPISGGEISPDPRSSREVGLALTSPMTAVEEESHRLMHSSSAEVETHSSTVQALWKAEQARLAAIYSSGRHNKRAASAERRPHRRSPFYQGVPVSAAESFRPGPPALAHLDQVAHPSSRSTSEDRGVSDAASDYSSNQRSSLFSSEASSSSYTIRTSIVESEPSTREEVRRLVDDMRSTYLRAIEAKAVQEELAQAADGGKHRRPSLPVSTLTASSFSAKARRKAKPSSWHSSDSAASNTMHPSRLSATEPSFGGISDDTSAGSSPAEETGGTIERADSLTLGTLMESLEASPRKSKEKASPTEEILALEAPAIVPV